jgi:hypothetical protein
LNQLFSKCLFVADHLAMIEEDWRQFLADYSNPTIRTLSDRNTSSQTDITPTKEKGKHLCSGS